MSEHIFISYARTDGVDFAQHLHDQLTNANNNVWFDLRDIPPGADWDEEIDKGLRFARVVVVVLTPGSVLSTQVKSEWNDALNRLLPVIPLLVINCPIPRVLGVFNYIDFRDDFDKGFALLHEKLNRLESDHLEHLQSLVQAFEVAQQNASEPRRFASKIEDLRLAVNNWQRRIEDQTYRVRQGIEQQKYDPAFPPNSLMRVAGRRPQEVVGYFKDREWEQRTIGQSISQEGVKLVSIIGRGGMGKTALVTKFLRELENARWPHTDTHIPVDGIVYLSTRTAGVSVERLFIDCATMLGGEGEIALMRTWSDLSLTTDQKIARLFGEMSNGLYVILMDNMEDELDENGTIRDAELRTFFEKELATTHGIRLLVTSRIAFNLKPETVRFERKIPLLEGLPVDDGVALLHDLDLQQLYGIQTTSRESLAKIVELVHGVPRALEVLIGMLSNDPFLQIENMLDKFHKSDDAVRAVIEEGYWKLNHSSKRVMEGLSVLRYPVPIIALDFLLQPFEPGLDIPTITRRLAQSHTVQVERSRQTVALHPIDQEYAYQQVSAYDVSNPYNRFALEARASEYYRSIRKANNLIKTIDDLEPQLREFEHLVRAEDYDLAALTLDDIDDQFLLPWGYARLVLNMRNELHGKIKDIALQCNHLISLSIMYSSLGYRTQSAEHAEFALNLARQNDLDHHEANALTQLAKASWELGKFADNIHYGEEGLNLYRTLNDLAGQARALEIVSTGYYSLGQAEKAIEYSKQSLANYSILNNLAGQAAALRKIGEAYRQLGNYGEAITYRQRALVITQEIGDRREQLKNLNMLGLIYISLGNLSAGITYCEQALAIAREIDDRDGEGFAMSNLGSAYLIAGKMQEAISYLEQAIAVFDEINYAFAKAFSLNSLGAAYLNLRQEEQANKYLQGAIKISSQMDSNKLKGYTTFNLARLSYARRNLLEALNFAEQSVAAFQSANSPQLSASLSMVLGLKAAQKGDVREEIKAWLDTASKLASAGDFFREALDICEHVKSIVANSEMVDLMPSVQETSDTIRGRLTFLV